MDQTIIDKWREMFGRVEEEHRKNGEQVVWVLVDGFLLFWHQVSHSGQNEVRSLIRASKGSR